MRCGRRDDIYNSLAIKASKDEDRWKEDNTCSFCGSINPEVFMSHLEAGLITITPTDKNYKIYVKGSSRFCKFYFQHLTLEEKLRFIELFNLGKIKLDEPGYFYIRPYFMVNINNTSLKDVT